MITVLLTIFCIIYWISNNHHLLQIISGIFLVLSLLTVMVFIATHLSSIFYWTIDHIF
jgi:hypothetical protein